MGDKLLLPQAVVDAALTCAEQSPCAKSKRGVCIFVAADADWRPNARVLSSGTVSTSVVLASAGHNRPPYGIACDGSPACRESCGRRCIHAEMAALRMLASGALPRDWNDRYDLVHVERAPDGSVVACDGPSCWQCSREILDVGIGGVWLYEARVAACPSDECRMCVGAACYKCGAGCWNNSPDKRCEHAADERHHGMPAAPSAEWKRYTAAEFHRVTCANAKDGGIYYGGEG